jgi:hypothetical protein
MGLLKPKCEDEVSRAEERRRKSKRSEVLVIECSNVDIGICSEWLSRRGSGSCNVRAGSPKWKEQ